MSLPRDSLYSCPTVRNMPFLDLEAAGAAPSDLAILAMVSKPTTRSTMGTQGSLSKYALDQYLKKYVRNNKSFLYRVYITVCSDLSKRCYYSSWQKLTIFPDVLHKCTGRITQQGRDIVVEWVHVFSQPRCGIIIHLNQIKTLLLL